MKIDKEKFREQLRRLRNYIKENILNLFKNGPFLIVLVSFIFILAHFMLPLATLTAISDNFNKIAIGIAAIITSYFGTSYLTEEANRRKAIRDWTKRFPPENYGISFKIIESERDPGAIYAHDMVNNKKHHIWNMLTVYDLGWQQYPRESMQH